MGLGLVSEDPYKVLGVSPDATAEEIRLAYRSAVLRYHPDTCTDAPAEAARKFSEIIEAYRRIRRSLPAREPDNGNGQAEQTFTPQDFTEWHWSAPNAEGRSQVPELRKRSFPTVDENRVFVCFWLLATALGIVAALISVALIPPAVGESDLAAGLVVFALPVGLYLAVVAGTIIALLATRRVVWLIVQVVVNLRRALPWPPKETGLPPTSPATRAGPVARPRKG